MKKNWAIAFLFLLPMVSFVLPKAFAVAPELLAVYSINSPVIDGSLGSVEWSDATRYVVNSSGPADIETWVYIKHNETHIHVGLVVWQPFDNFLDEFVIYFDEGNDSSHGSGTRDGVLTTNQEDLKMCKSSSDGVTLADGYYDNGTFTGPSAEIDFDANCTHETDHGTATWEIEYWEGLSWVDDHWECEFSIPLIGNDAGTDDVSDLVCTTADTVGFKFQYFIQSVGSYFYPAGTQYQIGTYASLSFLPPPSIESCDMTGVQKDAFDLGTTVYVNGSGYLPSSTYDIYVVEDVDWSDSMSIPIRVAGTAANVSSDSSGRIPPIAVWNNTMTVGKYDIVVDINGNGQYDAGVDALDDSDIQVTAGFFVPEFTSLIGMSLFMMATLVVAMCKRKHTT